MKCNTLIDPETKMALEGEELEAALKDLDSPRCGYELAQDDAFCPFCGAMVEGHPTRPQSRAWYSCKGRASRQEFRNMAAVYLLSNFLIFMSLTRNSDRGGGTIIIMGLAAFIYVYFVATSMRRLHDINRSGWWITPSCYSIAIAIIMILISTFGEINSGVFAVFDAVINFLYIAVPVYHFIILFWLASSKGTEGSNKYGLDPLTGKRNVGMKKMSQIVVLFAVSFAALVALSATAVQHYYCKYCGHKTTSVNSLTSSLCQRHPDGPAKGRHALYEGGEKASYVCKYCGLKSTSIASLTSSKCQRHPSGPAKGRHEPAL